MTNKFESLLELLINEENEKAEALFHEIVVEKSRDIYEGLADEDTKADAKEETKEAKDEAKEDNKEEVKETETTEAKDEKAEEKVEETAKEEAKDEEVKETAKEETAEAKEETKDEAKAEESIVTAPVVAKAPVEKTEEEKIEEIGGDATDELIKDISADDEGEGDKAADDMEVAMDPDAEANGEEQSQEERIVDLEDALDELKAEFEAMMGDKVDDNGEEEAEETAIAPAPVVPTQQTQPLVNSESKEAAKETVKEYKIQKSADNSDKADNKSSPVKATTSKHGGTPVKTGSGAEDKGRAAPTTKDVKSGGFENTGGKDKSTSMKKEAPKADTKDHSDKSAKSPVASRK